MIFNMVGGAGGGKDGAATLTVQAPINTDVTVSKDTKSYTKNSGSTGVAVFQGLTTGTWTVSISNEQQTQTRTVTITTTYSVVIAFFAATINITYPAGSTCTVTKGSTVFTAPDTSGTWDCVVPSTGTWVVACTDGELTSSQNVSITADGQVESITLAYFTATIAVTYPAGSTCTCENGNTVLTAPDTSGSYTFTVPNTGTWTVSCTDGTKTASKTVSITVDGQSASVTLTYDLYLFSETDGNLGNWSGSIDIYDGYMQTQDGNYMQSYCDLVDLTNYKTLYIDYEGVSGGGGNRTWVAPSTGKTINEGTGVQLTTGTRNTKSLDITAYNGNYRIVINAWYYQWKIYNIWLEPN